MGKSKSPVPVSSSYTKSDDPRSTTTTISNRRTSWNTLQYLNTKQSRCITPAASRVPHDILREIFEAYHVPGNPVRLPFRQHRPTRPWAFIHVCQGWREAGLAATDVWSYLHIEIPQNLGSVQAKTVTNLIDLCTGFSGRRPLHIRLSIFSPKHRGQSDSESVSPNPISLHVVWYSILLRRERWRELYVEASRLALKELVGYGHLNPVQPTPLLQTLYLRGKSEFGESCFPVSDVPLFDGESAPLLRTLLLYDNALLWAHEQAFPWQQLRELNLSGTYLGLKLEECLEILPSCKRLLRCKVSICRRLMGRQVAPVEPVVLPSLECLEIIDHNMPAQGGDVYHILQCPNLAEVTIRYMEGDNCDDESLLHQEKCFCPGVLSGKWPYS